MKLSDLTAVSETFSPLHPNIGEVDGLTFTLCSPFSREYNKNTARIHSDLLGNDADFDASDAWQIYQAEAVITGWSGIDDDNGNAIEFSFEASSKLFRNPEFFWMVVAVTDRLAKKKGYLQTLTKRLNALSE